MKENAQAESVDAVLGRVAGEFFQRVSQGEAPDVEEYTDRYPEIADEIRRAFPALGLIGESASSGRIQGEPIYLDRREELGDFRIIRELGRGGMGIVYEAEQRSIGRRVALKVLPFVALIDEKPLLRFHHEARAAATLDHPNIVSVYSVGEERGIHYYAMQLVRGPSMSMVIDSLKAMKEGQQSLDSNSISRAITSFELTAPHRLSGDSEDVVIDQLGHETVAQKMASTVPIESAREFSSNIAKIGIETAEALHYAHEQGIVHRDIKPANLMLDANHQVHITDFGLARIESEAGITMTGDLVGTLRYMAPEQALAKRVVIDSRTDIYSLGATLYELLTLRPVFDGEDRQTLLNQIADRAPKPPRQIDRRIPADLETIILKALSKIPDDRYASAQEMAHDLRHFINDEPIKARPLSTMQKSVRWSQKHIGLIGGIMVLLLIAVTGMSFAISLVANKNQLLAEAENRAQTNFQKATEVVNRFLKEVAESDELLRGTPGTQRVRSKFLVWTVEYFEEFLEQNRDSGLEEELMEAHYSLAEARSELGDTEKARSHLQSGIRICEKLILKDPATIKHQIALASGYIRLGGLTDDSPEEISICKKAVQIADQLVKSQGEDYHNMLAKAHNNLGNAYRHMGKHDEALSQFELAEEINQSLVDDDPQNEESWNDLRKHYHNIAELYNSRHQQDRAIEYYQKSIGIGERLVIQADHGDRYRYDLSKHYHNLGIIFHLQSRSDDAFQQFESAIKNCEVLVQNNPAVPDYRDMLRSHHMELGLVRRAQNQLEKAKFHLTKAVTESEWLVSRHGGRYLHGLSSSHHNLALVCESLGEPNEVLANLKKAVEYAEKLIAEFPHGSRYKSSLAISRFALADEFESQGQLDIAIKEFHEAALIWEQLTEEAESIVEYEGLANAYRALAMLYRKTGKYTESVDHFQKAIAFNERLLNEAPNTVRYRIELAHVCLDLSLYYSDRRSFDTAIDLITKCRTQLPTVPDAAPENKQVRWYSNKADELESNARNGRAWLLSTSSDSAIRNGQQAIEDAKRARKLSEKLNGVPSPVFLGTLAAAYAEVGRFDEAADLQQTVIESYPPDRRLNQIQRLHWYNEGRRYREPQNDEELVEQLLGSIELGDGDTKEGERTLFQYGLSRNHRQLGDVYLRTNRVDKAISQYQKAVELREQISKQHLDNNRFRVGLVDCQKRLATAYSTRGDLSKAVDLLNNALEDLQELAANGDVDKRLHEEVTKLRSELVAKMKQMNVDE